MIGSESKIPLKHVYGWILFDSIALPPTSTLCLPKLDLFWGVACFWIDSQGRGYLTIKNFILCPFSELCKDLFYPFNSHEGTRQDFPLQYQYNIKQTSDENKVKS